MEFEYAYIEDVVDHFSYYTTAMTGDKVSF